MGRFPSNTAANRKVDMTKTTSKAALTPTPIALRDCRPGLPSRLFPQLPSPNSSPISATTVCRPQLPYHFHGNVLNLKSAKMIRHSHRVVEKLVRLPSNMAATRNFNLTKTFNAAPKQPKLSPPIAVPKIPSVNPPPLAAVSSSIQFPW